MLLHLHERLANADPHRLQQCLTASTGPSGELVLHVIDRGTGVAAAERVVTFGPIRENTETPCLVLAYYQVIELVWGRYGWFSGLKEIPGGLVQSRRLDRWIGRAGQLCSPARCSS